MRFEIEGVHAASGKRIKPAIVEAVDAKDAIRKATAKGGKVDSVVNLDQPRKAEGSSLSGPGERKPSILLGLLRIPFALAFRLIRIGWRSLPLASFLVIVVLPSCAGLAQKMPSETLATLIGVCFAMWVAVLVVYKVISFVFGAGAKKPQGSR